jgi:ATP-GRASP peptide maturase of grasp-with-spasm system
MSKKILIISKNQLEISTEDVMDWLWMKGQNVVRINGDCFEDIIKNVKIIQENGRIEFFVESESIEEFDVVWLRRWSDASWMSLFDERFPFEISQALSSNMTKEFGAVRELFFQKLKAKMIITNRSQLTVNKLSVFEVAANIGLLVPDYIITNSKKDLDFFYRRAKNIVCKDIDSPIMINKDKEQTASYVELLTEELFESLPERFMLSLFQAYIEKEIEIRVFVLGDDLYSMAIFSQGDPKTKIDFRRYNITHPNRNVPYKLPDKIEAQIRALMKQLSLITGSIDLIKDFNGDYIFLEVNPVGQFGMVSFPCNYNLEEKVANYLYT